jgi:hypothetical protein
MARTKMGESFKLSALWRLTPSLCASSATSMSSSNSVSMWSDVNAIGTRQMSRCPSLARPSMESDVWGPCHARGPTWDCHVRRHLRVSRRKLYGQGIVRHRGSTLPLLRKS